MSFTNSFKRLILTDPLLLLLAVLLLLSVNVSSINNWAEKLDNSLYDRLIGFMQAPAPDDVVIVEIDESSLTMLGSWPWDRHYHGELIYTLHEGGASVVAYNVIFSEANSELIGDLALSEAIRISKNVVLPVYIDRLTQKGQLLEILPAALFAEHAALGHVNMHLDEDGVARSVYLREGLGSDYWPHFSLAAAHLSSSLPNPILGKETPHMLTDYVRKHHHAFPYVGDAGKFNRVSFVDVLSGDVPASYFDGKVVFVGMTATAMGDPLPTPLTHSGVQMPAVEINANIFQAIRQGQLISEAPLWLTLICNTLVLALALYAVPKLSGYNQLTLTVVATGGVLLFSYVMLTQFMWWAKSSSVMLGVMSIPVLWNTLRLNRLYHFLRAERHAFQQQAKDDLFIHAGVEILSHFTQNLQSLIQAISLDRYQLSKAGVVIQEKNAESLGRRFSYRLSVFTTDGEVVLRACFDPADMRHEQRRKILQGVFEQQKKFQQISHTSSRDIFFQQIRAVRQYKQQLHEARFLFESSIKMLGGGIIVGDVFGHVVFQNQQAESLLGANHSYYLKMLSQIQLSEEDKQWQSVLEQVLCDQQRVECEGKISHVDVAISLELINVPDTTVYLLLVHIADITRVRNAQRTRNEMIDFLSHDMRAPMTSLKAMVEQAKQQETQDQTVWYEQASAHINKSLHYTEQLLYLAKVESEDALQMYEADMYSVAQNAVDSLFYPAKQRGIHIDFHIDDDCWVWGNGDLLERVITNLLSNAIKYGQANSEVKLSVTNQNEKIRVAIRNHGEPISQEVQTLLFQPFKRSTDSQQKGIGLGLRFVDVTLKRHQSHIQLHSDDVFTEFSFELPALQEE